MIERPATKNKASRGSRTLPAIRLPLPGMSPKAAPLATNRATAGGRHPQGLETGRFRRRGRAGGRRAAVEGHRPAENPERTEDPPEVVAGELLARLERQPHPRDRLGIRSLARVRLHGRRNQRVEGPGHLVGHRGARTPGRRRVRRREKRAAREAETEIAARCFDAGAQEAHGRRRQERHAGSEQGHRQAGRDAADRPAETEDDRRRERASEQRPSRCPGDARGGRGARRPPASRTRRARAARRAPRRPPPRRERRWGSRTGRAWAARTPERRERSLGTREPRRAPIRSRRAAASRRASRWRTEAERSSERA